MKNGVLESGSAAPVTEYAVGPIGTARSRSRKTRLEAHKIYQFPALDAPHRIDQNRRGMKEIIPRRCFDKPLRLRG